MAKTTDPPAENPPAGADVDPPAPDIPADADQPTGEVTELDELRDENARLREEIAELRATAGPVAFTTDTVDRRREQAEHEQAVMFRSEGARQDREQQENAARTEGRPIAGDLRRDEADIDHDDLAPFDDETRDEQ